MAMWARLDGMLARKWSGSVAIVVYAIAEGLHASNEG